MPEAKHMTVRVLTPDECVEILARNHVGRLAYARANHIGIEPLHYVYHDGWLYGRTSEGTKMTITGYSWHPVAFEVDEIEGIFQWRSVVVHGGFYPMPTRPEGEELEAWNRGVELLRGLIPETFGAGDPVPFRTIIFRISVQEVSGRESAPASDEAEAPPPAG